MSEKKRPFPEEKFGPKLLQLAKDHRKNRVDKWGPTLEGLKLKGKGLDWVIVGCSWRGFTARDTSTQSSTPGMQGRYQWQGTFKEAEEDFDL